MEADHFAVFGGQGPPWLAELATLYRDRPSTRPLIERAAAIVEKEASNPEISELFNVGGFRLLPWLNNLDVPESSRLSQAPISCPMIFLAQMANYLDVCSQLRKSPSDVKKLFRGATGHSQGLMGAIVFSIADTEDELIDLILKTVTFMVWFGARLQSLTNLKFDGNVGDCASRTSPMLAVLQIDEHRLAEYISQVNDSIEEEERRIMIGLRNAPTCNIVVGHPESLAQLHSSLQHANLDSQNNSGIFSRLLSLIRKKPAPIVCKFLAVSVPFHHSELLSPIVKTLLKDAKRLKFDILANSMTLPVYASDGKDDDQNPFPRVLNPSSNLLQDLITLQAVSVVDWIHTCLPIDPLRGVRTLVDFGPGGKNGIGALCERNMKDSGIQITLASSLMGNTPDSSSSAPSASSSSQQGKNSSSR